MRYNEKHFFYQLITIKKSIFQAIKKGFYRVDRLPISNRSPTKIIDFCIWFHTRPSMKIAGEPPKIAVCGLIFVGS
jgi:hypothetical protein